MLNFDLLETEMHPLWDFGWFDISRFSVEGSMDRLDDGLCVLSQFLKDPISQRSFCDPRRWGEAIGRHGPYLHSKLDAKWFERTSFAKFSEVLRRALADPSFDEPPSTSQRGIVESFVDSMNSISAETYVLVPPECSNVRVDWDHVWHVYREFACMSPSHGDLYLAVIGYD